MSMESLYRMSIMVNMIDKFSGPSAAISHATGGIAKDVSAMNSKAADAGKSASVLATAGSSITNAVLKPVKATFKIQDALAELSSLGVTKLGKLEAAAEQFSMTWAGTTKSDFITAAYDIKSGISSLTDAGVADMTRLAALTAKATKSTAAEMTNLFATGYGIYKDYYSQMSDLEFGEMFSGGIAQSVQMFKTTGSGMAQAISALGGSATAAGAPLEEQFAILGMLQATMSGSEAGTKYTAFLQNAARAGDELGLSFTDTNGQLLSMPSILGAIKGKFGDVMTATDKLELQKAFGTVEAVKLIDLLYGKTDDLQTNILTLYDTMGEGMKITEEMANKINAPPSQGWVLMTQQLQNVKETIGNAMLPTFIKLQQDLAPVLETVADFISKNSETVSTIMYVVAAIGLYLMVIATLKSSMLAAAGIKVFAIGIWKSLKVAMWGVKNASFLVQYGMYNLGLVFGPLKVGLVTATKAAWGFFAALLANPITWVVIGIVALIAALVLLWQNWDTVVQFFQNGFAKIRELFGGLPGWVQAAIAIFMPFIGIPLLIVQHWESIKAFFVGLIEWFRNIGASIMNSFTNGIMSFINAPFEAVKSALEKVRSLLPFSDAKTGPLSDLTLSGSRVFTTFNEGMEETANLPVDTASDAFGKMPLEQESESGRNGKTTIIEKVILYIKPDDIADLQKLKKLLEEIEGMNNANIGFDPVPEV